MQYIEHGNGGDAAVMHLAEAEMPVLRSGEVLIEVHYAGVNRPDVLQRAGSYPPPEGASKILGLEVAGIIVDKAPDVTQWEIGNRVCALTPGGGYATHCACPAVHCLPIPDGFSLLEAAALPENYFTVWTNVFERGRLKQGETLLVHGGSSGIGLTALQMAKEFGADVIVTVGSAEKAAFCKKMGADLAINYRESDFVDAVKAHMKGRDKRGVDVILDMVGGDYINKNIQLLAQEGRLVQIAFMQKSVTQIDAMPIMIKRLTFTGSTLRPRTIAEKAAIAKALQTTLWHVLAEGHCKPVIAKVFPLADAVAAHQLMESSAHIGKIMLQVKQD
ncbi:NAD(P)H-quinone oxidoreductase [Oxalobacteraceae bacterium CAVE-383]|nr:NAD(P)H-quinone oxidoreductase [Oxalobacteraceae bacterium CAVE-383]